jgi:hypothetical protein
MENDANFGLTILPPLLPTIIREHMALYGQGPGTQSKRSIGKKY